MQASRALIVLGTLFSFAMRMRIETCGTTSEAAMTAVARAIELQTYLQYIGSAVVNYPHRRRLGKADSTSPMLTWARRNA